MLVALLLLVTASACGTEVSPGSAPTGDDLAGSYVVTAVTEGGERRDLVPGSEIRLTFTDGTLGLHAGCNHLSGEYTLDGDRLRVGGIGGTEMGCPKPLMEQDQWLAGLFEGTVKVGHDPLTLTAGDVVLTLTPREEASPDRPLVGTRWVLDGLVGGDAVSSVPAGPKVVLSLRDRSAEITGLCNGWSAETTVADGAISWAPGMRTLMACADERRQRLDNEVSALLAGRTAYEIEERTLRVTRGGRGLVFVADE